MLGKISEFLKHEYSVFVVLSNKDKLKYIFRAFVKYELFVLKYLILVPIVVIDFLGGTWAGMGVLVILYLGIFVLPYPINWIILFFLADLLVTAFYVLIASQFESSRNLLILLIGEGNYKEYIGDNPGSKLGKHIVKVGGIGLGLGVSLLGMEFFHNQINSLGAMQYANDCKKMGVPIDVERFHKYYDRRFYDIANNLMKKSKK